MVNDTKTCQQPHCTGHMVYRSTLPAGELVAGDATSHVDVYECSDCGARDWE